MLDDREHRLRLRIDALLDQRAQALQALANTRRDLHRARHSLYAARASRDLWKTRALRR